MPGHTIARRVRAGEARAVDVVDDALRRAEASPHNDFTEVTADLAQQRAATIDAMVAEGVDPGPLAGVPIAIKDLIDQLGSVTTAGSKFFRHRPERTATAVERLEAAGAVVVGRTNLHEFAYGFSSENPWFGPVRNPWDTSTSPGGSSGGSAVAVATGTVPVAVGTDTGGSIRVPAALCGVMGLKPTHGRIPLTGVFPLAASLDTVGPLAASVQDLAIAYRAMAGPDPLDPWSVHGAPSPRAAHDPLRIGVPRPWVGTGPVHPEVLAAFETALVDLSLLGFEVVDVDVPDLVPWGRIDDLAGAQIASVHRAWVTGGRPYGTEVAARLEGALRVGVDDLVASLTWQAAVKNVAREVFTSVDLLATPSTGVTRKVIDDDDVDVGHGAKSSYRPALAWFSALVNHLGSPAISLPLAMVGNPPPSIQLIAPWWSEETLIAAARRLEREGLVGVRPPS